LSSSQRFSALAHRHAVAFLLIVTFDVSNSAAMAATIAIVAIIAIVVSTAMRPSSQLPSHSRIFLSALAQRSSRKISIHCAIRGAIAMIPLPWWWFLGAPWAHQKTCA
jgi:hypothetical protein